MAVEVTILGKITKHGKIVGYKLKDTNGNTADIKVSALSREINNKNIIIVEDKKELKPIRVICKDLDVVDSDTKLKFRTINKDKLDSMLLRAKSVGMSTKQLRPHLYAMQNNEETIMLSDRNILIYHADNSQAFVGTHFTEIDLRNTQLDPTVKSLESMFGYCKARKIIFDKSWDTSNVTSLNSLFFYCENLEEVNIEVFNTENVLNMENMFRDCASLKEINLKNVNTSKVLNASMLFLGCNNLKSVDLSSFDTENMVTIWGMFKECHKLVEINISNFNWSNIRNIEALFAECKSLEKISFGKLLTKYSLSTQHLFRSCTKLKELIFAELDEIECSVTIYSNLDEIENALTKEGLTTKINYIDIN